VELIKEALKKAKATGLVDIRELPPRRPPSSALAPAWAPPRVVLDPKHLEQHRIVSYGMTDPNHVAFNLLRTKIYKVMKANGWKSLAVLSPTPGCGKTTVSLNLAFSMSRQASCRTVVIDLDLKKSAMAKALGVKPKGSLGDYLEGKVDAEDCFLQVTDNLFVGINATSVKYSSEHLQNERLDDLLKRVMDLLRPDVVLFDLPPMLSSDDAIAFLPRVDCSVLVVGAGMATAKQIDECERQASAASNYLGVVLNKCQSTSTEFYQYDY
jgi:capsular exopolysaccharide synthesis family protein